MAKPVRMHVARTPSKYVDKAGIVHRYESVLVRRTYRDGDKVRHETLANLSKLPAETVAVIEATLKGQVMVPAEAACTIIRSLPHGTLNARRPRPEKRKEKKKRREEEICENSVGKT